VPRNPISTKSLIIANSRGRGRETCSLSSMWSFESLLASIEYVPRRRRLSRISHQRYRSFSRRISVFLVPRSSGLRVLGTVWNSPLFPWPRLPRAHALLTSFVGGATDPSAASLPAEALASLVHRENSRPSFPFSAETRLFQTSPFGPAPSRSNNLGHSDRLVAVAKTSAEAPWDLARGQLPARARHRLLASNKPWQSRMKCVRRSKSEARSDHRRAR